MRRLGCLVVDVLVLALVLGGLVLADRTARRLVEDRMADVLTSRIQARPTVEVGGWSTLYSLATDTWPSVRVRAGRVTTGAAGIPLHARVDLQARGVRGLVRGSRIEADAVEGTVAPDLADVGRRTGTRLTTAPGGRVAASGTVPVLGRDLSVTVTGSPHVVVADQRLELLSPQVRIGGREAPAGAVAGMASRLQDRLRLPRVPGVTVTRATVEGGLVVLEVRGVDLSLPHR